MHLVGLQYREDRPRHLIVSDMRIPIIYIKRVSGAKISAGLKAVLMRLQLIDF